MFGRAESKDVMVGLRMWKKLGEEVRGETDVPPLRLSALSWSDMSKMTDRESKNPMQERCLLDCKDK